MRHCSKFVLSGKWFGSNINLKSRSAFDIGMHSTVFQTSLPPSNPLPPLKQKLNSIWVIDKAYNLFLNSMGSIKRAYTYNMYSPLSHMVCQLHHARVKFAIPVLCLCVEYVDERAKLAMSFYLGIAKELFVCENIDCVCVRACVCKVKK